ncbi:MAG: ABC transporter permease [Peptococcaceae bacterium]|nr:ABC transporter permease [Peptococcaceae bacterium]
MHIDYWREVKKSGPGRAGLAAITAVAALAVLAPLFTGHQPGEYTGAIFHPPSREYWLGTNDVGQDIWTHLLYGARTSLAVGCGAAALSAIVSALVGGLAALSGGITDRVLMRLTDSLLVVPPIMVAILAAAYFRPGAALLVFLLAAVMWPGGARLVRSQALAAKERAHVAAARTFGAGRLYLLTRHIMPEIGPVIIAVLVMDARRAVFMEAGLSFLGVADPAVVSWGKMMQQALRFSYLDVWKWWLLPAGAALSLTVAGLAFTGFALETVLNPRLKERDR